ncbi:MAG: hypothetical protein JW917_08275 [Ignavibacteria bacterium]|nr:hypothetical protein [Ignavibacteria bacterium]
MVEQKYSRITEKDITRGKMLVTDFTYTESGKLKNKTSRYESGEVWFSKNYEYDDEGKLIFEEHYRNEYPGDETKSIYSKFEYKYDNDGNLIDAIERNRDGIMLSRSLNEYRSNGNMKLSRRTRYNISGKVLNINFIEFNESGDISYKRSFKPNGAVSNIFKYNYDSNGLLISKAYIQPSGNVLQKYIYDYENGNMKSEKVYVKNELTGQKDFNEDKMLIKEMTKNTNGVILVTEYEYYPNQKIKGKRTYKNYELSQKEIYKYNDNFDIKEKTTLETQSGASTSEVYEYFDWGYTVDYVMKTGGKEYRKWYEYRIRNKQ